MTARRVGRRDLDRLVAEMTKTDWPLLKLLNSHQYLTSIQIAEFLFVDRPSRFASIRAAHRQLRRLAATHVISELGARRVGGTRRGSAASIWTLTHTGLRLLAQRDGTTVSRRRLIEPTYPFLHHALAVGDAHLALERADRAGVLRLREVVVEPWCWRKYLSMTGVVTTLKPDMAAETETPDYEDRWFFEVDRATEAPSRVIAKCRQYQEYARTGTEQDRHGVFPLVVWVTPDGERAEQLRRHLTSDNGVQGKLFGVTTMAGLEDFLSAPEPLIAAESGWEKGGSS